MGNDSLAIKNTSEYKDISVAETLKIVHSLNNGLTESEVKLRLQKFGFNEVSEKKQNSYSRF